MRIDKWLWAARFYKSRNLAKEAVESGKVLVNGQRVKPSREIAPGLMLQIRQGFDEKTLLVLKLNEQRRPAKEAAELYSETAESLAARQAAQAARQLEGPSPAADGKPNKKQRRQIHRFFDDW